MKIPLIFPYNKNIDLFKKKNFLTLIKSENYRCICGRTYSKETIKVEESGFYMCPYCKSYRKFSEKNSVDNHAYVVSENLLKKQIRFKLKELGANFVEKFNEFYLRIGKILVPLGVLEFSNPSLLNPKSHATIIYYHIPDFEKNKNIYSEKRMVELGYFFKMDKKTFDSFISSIKKNLEIDKIFKIKEKITLFCNKKKPEHFEVEINKMFSTIRDKSPQVELMLKFFKDNHNLPFSKKPIHLGGNHPLDIEFIDLFDYFNQLFNISQNKGAEVKRYCVAEVTKGTITNKLITSHGREMIIITNKDKVSKKAWKYVWDTKNDNQEWKFFILDLDLLSLILYHLDLNDLFNP